MKKLEIIQDLINSSKAWTEQTKCCTITCAAGKPRNLLRNLCSFMLHMVSLHSFTLVKKYTTNQNQKGNGYTLKDFILDCVWSMTEPEGREDEKHSTED
jgi:hypothetical protein